MLSITRLLLAAWPVFGVLGEVVDRAPRLLRGAVVGALMIASVAFLHDWRLRIFVG
jgi:hypothetical protein